MQKIYRKQHIYTFVVGKKSSVIFASILIISFAVILYRGIFSDTQNIYTALYNKCYFNFSESANIKDGITKSLKPDMQTIIQTASPMLYETANSDNEEKEIKSDIIPTSLPGKKSEHKISENNITSENMAFKNETSYEIDIQNLLKTQTNYVATGDLPRVLILHTHACEAYSDESGNPSGDNGTYRSISNSKNMIYIGNRISDNLTASGINVIHDTTQCDYPSYNTAYKNSLGVANWYLERYPSINFIFDIHRDAITDANNIPTKLTHTVNGNKVAQIMTVCGTDAMGLEHPNWHENLVLASKIQHYLEKKYPGIARPLNIRRERFNMHTTTGSLIFEIGTHANTLDEALKGADILSEAIAEVLLNK